jgi:pyrroline-5-carboxylate reductase
MLDTTKTIGFIGGGNMAAAIIGGLLKAGMPASNIIVSDPFEPTRTSLQKNMGVKTTIDNTLVCVSDVLILAVKPYLYLTQSSNEGCM